MPPRDPVFQAEPGQCKTCLREDNNEVDSDTGLGKKCWQKWSQREIADKAKSP